MRVDYTLPALQPGTLPDAPQTTQEGAPSFRDLVRGEVTPLPQTVEQQLRLDARPFTATYIGPPPRPSNLEIRDADTQRALWRNMLWRHSSTETEALNRPGAGQPVQAMLGMLLDMQDLEDSIVAQSVAVTRG